MIKISPIRGRANTMTLLRRIAKNFGTCFHISEKKIVILIAK